MPSTYTSYIHSASTLEVYICSQFSTLHYPNGGLVRDLANPEDNIVSVSSFLYLQICAGADMLLFLHTQKNSFQAK